MSHKKEVIKNIFSFGSIDILGLLIPIITMPILTRALGPSQYGIYMLLLTILYFGHTIIDYGTQYTSVRLLARNRGNPKKINYIYRKTQGLRLFLYFFYSMIVILYCLFFTEKNVDHYMIFAIFTYLLGYALTPLWFYQGIGAVDIAMRVSLIVKLANLTVIILFVKTPNDMFIVITSLCLPMLLGGLLLSYLAHSRYNIGLPTLSRLNRSFIEGRDVFLGLLAPNLYNSIPTIALGTIYTPAEFASFAIASRLSSVIVTVQNVIAKAIYPIITIQKNNHVNKLLITNFVVSIIPAILIYFIGEWALQIFLGKSFSGVNQYLFILCIGIVFIGLSNAISQGYFLPNRHDKLYRNISLRVSIISAIIVIIMIYYYGLLGGAIAVTIARILFFIDYLTVYQNLKSAKPSVF
ncbi:MULTISPECIES: lipopolysaccharide biosynthesis protein [unclassified Providencia]|uniref:lipopolysaccharide biosynthesis protein n=1 Tax=unclassified Providencia TaxID=2633465 RepID=UPI00234975EC|nr:MULTISPECIES: oligosaccharide flippase family protein [unclassified Providencia]